MKIGMLSIGLLILLLVGVGSASPSTQGAPNTDAVAVTMPFAGKWAWTILKARCGSDRCDSHPSYHEKYSADWATDLYAPPGTAVKFNVSGATTGLSYSASITDTSCGAGKRVRITLKTGGTTLGWAQYDHLDITGISFASIANNKTLGVTKNWGKKSCYVVSSDAGVHTHFSAANTSKYSCWIDYGSVGTPLAANATIAIVGSNNTGVQQKCSPGASVSGYANTIVQWNGDTKAQKTAWFVNPSAQRQWIPTIPIYNCLAAKARGPVQLPRKVLDLLTDTGQSAACGSSPPPSPPSNSTPPNITAITDTTGVVTTRYVWTTVRFRDPECDVTGGTWEGASGSGLREDFGRTIRADLMRGLVCSGGSGSLQFARSCLWRGRWTEYMTLVDSRGNRSSRVPFVYVCS